MSGWRGSVVARPALFGAVTASGLGCGLLSLHLRLAPVPDGLLLRGQDFDGLVLKLPHLRLHVLHALCEFFATGSAAAAAWETPKVLAALHVQITQLLLLLFGQVDLLSKGFTAQLPTQAGFTTTESKPAATATTATGTTTRAAGSAYFARRFVCPSASRRLCESDIDCQKQAHA